MIATAFLMMGRGKMDFCTRYDVKGYDRDIPPVAIGDGIPKLITILGITNSSQTIIDELEKSKVAHKHGASIIADVSTEGDISDFHSKLIEDIPMPLSTVPIYEIRHRGIADNLWPHKVTKNYILDIIQEQAERGVGCMTFHTAISKELFEQAKKTDRKIQLQARGGGLIFDYMKSHDCENPFYEFFDEILVLLKKYNIALSFGSSLRSGTISDPPDELNIHEQLTHAELSRRATEVGVNIMFEIGSHHRYCLIGPYVKYMKSHMHRLPLRLLGPIGTEKGLGYDHITAAISSVPAIQAGLDIITCVTRSEHIGLPDANDIRESLIAMRIAIELAFQDETPTKKSDIDFKCGLGFKSFKPDDLIDLERALELKRQKNNGSLDGCNMCNESCRMILGK